MGAPRSSVPLFMVLVALLVATGVAAWVLGGRTFTGFAPAGGPREIPASGAGPPNVELSGDAERHPAAGAVRSQLQRYFDAINTRDYELWTTSVAAERVAAQPRDQWLAAIDTTADGTIRVDRIDRIGQGRLLVLVRFVSIQGLDDAPAGLRVGRICWRGSLPMTGDPPRLDTGNAANLMAAPC